MCAASSVLEGALTLVCSLQKLLSASSPRPRAPCWALSLSRGTSPGPRSPAGHCGRRATCCYWPAQSPRAGERSPLVSKGGLMAPVSSDSRMWALCHFAQRGATGVAAWVISLKVGSALFL